MAWIVDPKSSSVELVAQHLQVTTVRGRFDIFEGTLEMDEENPEQSSVEGTVDAASIRTGIGMRDSSLRAPGRLDAQAHPKLNFRSTRVGEFKGDKFQVYGDLTIKDITRPVVFDVVNKGEVDSGDGPRRWAFDATVLLNRKDFGIKWSVLMEMGGLTVADEVTGEFKIQFVQE